VKRVIRFRVAHAGSVRSQPCRDCCTSDAKRSQRVAAGPIPDSDRRRASVSRADSADYPAVTSTPPFVAGGRSPAGGSCHRDWRDPRWLRPTFGSRDREPLDHRESDGLHRRPRANSPTRHRSIGRGLRQMPVSRSVGRIDLVLDPCALRSPSDPFCRIPALVYSSGCRRGPSGLWGGTAHGPGVACFDTLKSRARHPLALPTWGFASPMPDWKSRDAAAYWGRTVELALPQQDIVSQRCDLVRQTVSKGLGAPESLEPSRAREELRGDRNLGSVPLSPREEGRSRSVRLSNSM
jgi:hypothetical protein